MTAGKRKKANEDIFLKYSPKAARMLRTVSQNVIDNPEVSLRQMFGCSAFFANGNIFCLLDPDEEILYVRATDRELFSEIKKIRGSKLFAPGGTGMKNWVSVPDSVIKDEDRLAHYLDAVYKLALALPPKIFKTRSRRV